VAPGVLGAALLDEGGEGLAGDAEALGGLLGEGGPGDAGDELEGRVEVVVELGLGR